MQHGGYQNDRLRHHELCNLPYIIWIRIDKQQKTQTFSSHLPFLDVSETHRWFATGTEVQCSHCGIRNCTLPLAACPCSMEWPMCTDRDLCHQCGGNSFERCTCPQEWEHTFRYLPISSQTKIVKGWTFSFREATKIAEICSMSFLSQPHHPQHTVSCRICPIKEDTKKLRNTSLCFLIVHSIYIFWSELLHHAIRFAKQSYIFLHSSTPRISLTGALLWERAFSLFVCSQDGGQLLDTES